MTSQTEQQLRQEARARGWDKAKEDAYVQYMDSKIQAQLPQAPQSTPQKQAGDGFLKTIIKDPIKTLIVKPGTRIAQAGVGLVTNSLGNDTENKRGNIQQQIDGLLVQARNASPDQKATLLNQAKALQQQLSPLERRLTSLNDIGNRAFDDTSVKLPGTSFDIERQKSGIEGAKQIAGDAAKSASYLYTPGAAKGVLATGFKGAIKQGALQGLKAGAIGGGLYSGGEALQENKSAGQIATDTLKGAATGAAIGGAIGGAVPVVAKTIEKAGETVSKVLPKGGPLSSEARVITQRTRELSKLENSNSKLRKLSAASEAKGINVKKMLSETDLLHNAVDDNGTIRTQNAIHDLNEFIRPQENVISQNLQKEGNKISLGTVEQHLKAAIDQSGLKGGAKLRALKNVEDDIAGYTLEGDKQGQILVSVLHDAKVDKYANINYLNPETKRADKAIAKGLKELVEKHTKSVDVKTLNKELSQWFSLQQYLEALDGKKVDGGKLGKYFAQTLGGIAGSHFGPLGTVVGAEAAGRIRGLMMKSKFSGKIGRELEQSPAMQKAIEAGKEKVINL